MNTLQEANLSVELVIHTNSVKVEVTMYSQNDKSQAVANEDDDPLSPPLDLAFVRSLRKPREVIIILGWNSSSSRKEPFVYGSIDYIIFFGFQCKF